METIKIKHREFEIIETVSDNSFIASRKNKKFFVRKFKPYEQEGKELMYALDKIKTSGVSAPKLFWIDKKLGYAVCEYLEGQLMSDYLSKNDMNDSLFEQLFKNAYFAKLSHMTLSYEPDKWMLVNDTLYYIYPVFIIYKKEKDLAERYIRLWFNTTELFEFLKQKGIFYDKKRIKNEYVTNKEIVLTTCKYYR